MTSDDGTGSADYPWTDAAAKGEFSEPRSACYVGSQRSAISSQRSA